VRAMLMYARPNLLLLDVAAKYLDLDSRHALLLALEGFEGGLLVVAHHRHLLRTTADTLLLVNDGRVTDWEGDLDDYAKWLGGGRRELPWETPTSPAPSAAAASAGDRGNDKARRQQGAQLRAQLKPLRDAVKQAESVMERVQKKRTELEAKLADASLYEPARRDELKGLLLDKARLESQLEDAENDWLTHSEALEVAEREALA